MNIDDHYSPVSIWSNQEEFYFNYGSSITVLVKYQILVTVNNEASNCHYLNEISSPPTA